MVSGYRDLTKKTFESAYEFAGRAVAPPYERLSSLVLLLNEVISVSLRAPCAKIINEQDLFLCVVETALAVGVAVERLPVVVVRLEIPQIGITQHQNL